MKPTLQVFSILLLLPLLGPTADPAPTVARQEMVLVHGGTFTMGCLSNDRDGECNDDEKPAHEVQVADFYIGKFEVTQAQWRAVMGSDPQKLYNKGCDQCPVEEVSWNDIQAFLIALNSQTGKKYRLPTEAEWEYAARGGNQSQGYLYSGSNDINEVAWYGENYKSGASTGIRKTTQPVGTNRSNELGIYDMSGNVWEWVEDDWHGNYQGAPDSGSAWVDSPERGRYRVQRGGCWSSGKAGNCRNSKRRYGLPGGDSFDRGFRLASFQQ